MGTKFITADEARALLKANTEEKEMTSYLDWLNHMITDSAESGFNYLNFGQKSYTSKECHEKTMAVVKSKGFTVEEIPVKNQKPYYRISW